MLYLFPFNLLTFCLPANDGGIQFAPTGLGWRRESDAAVFNGYIYQRLHNLWHSGKCHFWPMCSESHFTVWQHRLYRSEVHRQTNGALHLQGIVTVYFNSNKSSVWNATLFKPYGLNSLLTFATPITTTIFISLLQNWVRGILLFAINYWLAIWTNAPMF